MIFLLRFWPYLVGAVGLIGLALYLNHAGYKSGYAASEAQWQNRFAAAELARDEANAKAARQEADSTRLSQTAEAEHEQTVASLNLRAADADKRLRALSVRLAAASTCSGTLPAVPGTPAVPDAATAGAERAERAGASIADVGRRCELDAAGYTELQSWITSQRAIINPQGVGTPASDARRDR